MTSGELDRMLERKRKIEAQLKGTSARGPARGRRRKQAEERLEEIEGSLRGFEWGWCIELKTAALRLANESGDRWTGWRLPARR